VKYTGLSDGLRRDINERDGNRCRWCGSTNQGVDHHHIEYRKGASHDVLENLVSLCRPCHGFVHGTPRPSGERISKDVAQQVLFWVVSNSGRVGTSRYRALKRRFVLEGLCRHGQKKDTCPYC